MKEKIVRFGEYDLAGSFHLPLVKSSKCVIACHGLYSSRNSEKYVDIAKRFCKEGFAVLRFDFRGCGESVGRFEDTSLTGRIEDLKLALDFVEERGYKKVGVMGSSLGGTVAVLTTAEDGRIRTLVTWAAASRLDELFRGKIVGLEMLRVDAAKYDVRKAVMEIRCPFLIIHGSLDEQVSPSDAEFLYEYMGKPKRIEIIEGADHRLTNPTHRRRAIEETLNWFEEYLT